MNDLTTLTKRLAELREAAADMSCSNMDRVIRAAHMESFAYDNASAIHAAAVELDGEVERLREEENQQWQILEAFCKHLEVGPHASDSLSDLRSIVANNYALRMTEACKIRDDLAAEVKRLTAELAAERAGAAGLREALVDLCAEVGASVVCGANHNTREVAQAYDRALHAIAATAGRDTLAELERLRAENGKLRGLLDSVVVEVREYVDQDSRDRIQFEAEVRGIPSDCNLGCDDADSVRQWIASRDAALADGKAVP